MPARLAAGSGASTGPVEGGVGLAAIEIGFEPAHSSRVGLYFSEQNKMIISMRPHATRQEIEHVCERIREFGYKVHSIEGEERVVIGVVGVGDVTACLESLEAVPAVESA